MDDILKTAREFLDTLDPDRASERELDAMVRGLVEALEHAIEDRDAARVALRGLALQLRAMAGAVLEEFNK